MLKRVQLTISGCVGPCDVPNVVVITSSSGTEWLGNIVTFDQYRRLVEWAVRCRDAGKMLPYRPRFINAGWVLLLRSTLCGRCRDNVCGRGTMRFPVVQQRVSNL